MKWLGIALMALLVSGCGLLERFWDDEVLSKYAPNVLVEQQKTHLAESLNSWLGRPKSERIRVAGNPQECVTLSPAGERCEWKSAWVTTNSASPAGQSRMTGSDGRYQYIAFLYDRSGVASSWSYRGPYGEFTNSNYKEMKAGPASSSQPAASPETEWTHPTKARDAFSQDYFQCQEDMKRDPRGQQGAKFLMQDAIDRCVKEKGWVQNGKP
jgi:hypothetical protein